MKLDFDAENSDVIGFICFWNFKGNDNPV